MNYVYSNKDQTVFSEVMVNKGIANSKISESQELEIVELSKRIIELKQIDSAIIELEKIDQMVYQLYDLTEEEIDII